MVAHMKMEQMILCTVCEIFCQNFKYISMGFTDKNKSNIKVFYRIYFKFLTVFLGITSTIITVYFINK